MWFVVQLKHFKGKSNLCQQYLDFTSQLVEQKCGNKRIDDQWRRYATLALKVLVKKDCEILLSIWSDGMTNCNFWLIAVKDLQISKYDQSVMLRSDIEWKRKGCGLCWF